MRTVFSGHNYANGKKHGGSKILLEKICGFIGVFANVVNNDAYVYYFPAASVFAGVSAVQSFSHLFRG
ncbi:MAG TPA: hypothetical protein PKK36_08675, partial [Kiritimatiellia bacterium]|nr:hypothetical protein [Kiritimatiellia bacterium]